MPKQMNFTTADGVNHPESYWKLDVLTLDRINKTAIAVLKGWHNKAAYDASAQPLMGAIRTYTAYSSAFDEYFGTAELIPEAKTPYKQAYTLAENIKDIATGEFENLGTDEEPNMQEIYVGFFDNAITVDV